MSSIFHRINNAIHGKEVPMATHCRAPGCGRFVKEGAERCDHHPEGPSARDDDGLTLVIDALQDALERLSAEQDIDILGKYLPRVSSVLIQAVRARYQIGGQGTSDYLTALGPILEEVERLQKSTAS
jgi:hypothetical protein